MRLDASTQVKARRGLRDATAGKVASSEADKECAMGWLASFKGLRGLGIPPIIAAGVLLLLFLLVRRNDERTAPSGD